MPQFRVREDVSHDGRLQSVDWLEEGRRYRGLEIPTLKDGRYVRLFEPDGGESAELPGEEVERC